MLFDLTDAEWDVIVQSLQGAWIRAKRWPYGHNRHLYVLHTGAPWRNFSDQYGPHVTVYNRYGGAVGQLRLASLKCFARYKHR